MRGYPLFGLRNVDRMSDEGLQFVGPTPGRWLQES